MRMMMPIGIPVEAGNEAARAGALRPPFQKGNTGYLMKRAMFLVVVAVIGLPSHPSAQTDPVNSIQKVFVGTWKLASYVSEDVASGAKSEALGSHPAGYINYGSDGHMIVVIVGSDRKKPAGSVVTPDEAEALIRSMLAYAGTYTINGEKKIVTHHVEISWDQSRAGTDVVRSYRLEGDRLTLMTEPSNDPVTGRKTVRTVVWERAKQN